MNVRLPNWLRLVLAIVAGFIAWFVVATVANILVRWLVPGYAQVEKAMDFSLGMMVARLIVGAAASIAAGAACAAVARARVPEYVFSVLLLALFVPVHVNLWAKFPWWYHLLFLGSLVPLVILGARLIGSRGASAP